MESDREVEACRMEVKHQESNWSNMERMWMGKKKKRKMFQEDPGAKACQIKMTKRIQNRLPETENNLKVATLGVLPVVLSGFMTRRKEEVAHLAVKMKGSLLDQVNKLPFLLRKMPICMILKNPVKKKILEVLLVVAPKVWKETMPERRATVVTMSPSKDDPRAKNPQKAVPVAGRKVLRVLVI